MTHVLISGSSGNLGVATTSVFLEGGYHTHALVRPGTAEHPIDHRLLSVHALDLLKETECTEFISQMPYCPQTAVLTAGGFAMGSIEETDGEALTHMIDLNFRTAYHLARPLWRRWGEEGIRGNLFLIGARPAMEPEKGSQMLAYSLSKSLVVQFVKSLNGSRQSKGRRAFACIPDTLDTPQNRKSMPEADQSRWVKPESIAEWIYLLASGKSEGISQQTIAFYGRG